ncbi:MAG: F0F1 ATP synthase subunit epsilon [Myxococcales bacterium]|nr:F0F1 ATP synthase subunit epsilon [Myxococcales bacterium]
MTLTILEPAAVHLPPTPVRRVVVETPRGSHGLLPRRLDCVAAVPPGILTYETMDGAVVDVAVDLGVMVKAGPAVTVAVRHAIAGTDLSTLRDTVARAFVDLDAQAQATRAALAHLETSFVRRLLEWERV